MDVYCWEVCGFAVLGFWGLVRVKYGVWEIRVVFWFSGISFFRIEVFFAWNLGYFVFLFRFFNLRVVERV